RDPVAHAASSSARAALDVIGVQVPEALRAVRSTGLRVKIDARASEVDNAEGGGNTLLFGVPRRMFARSAARSPGIVGHELAHVLMDSFGPEEGLADLVGAAVAHGTGRFDPARPWLVGSDVVRGSWLVRGGARDISQPRYATVEQLVAAV